VPTTFFFTQSGFSSRFHLSIEKPQWLGSKGSKGKRNRKDQGRKRKRPPTPPSEDFLDSEFSEEQFSFEGEESSPPVPLSPSSEGSDDSMGLSTAERAYVRFVKRAGLKGTVDSEEEDSKEEGGSGADGSDYDGGNEGGNNVNDGGRGSGGDDSCYDGSDEGGIGKGRGGIGKGRGGSGNVSCKAPPA
jgi:hypothetical protein